MTLALGFILSYLIGSIPTAYILAKQIKRTDIREFGSGNVGATNATRLLGKKAGAIILIIDIFKGFIPVTTLATFFLLNSDTVNPLTIRCLYGSAAFLGHNWSCFLKFKGGKGVATTAGIFLGLTPGIVFIAGGIWAIVLFATHYVSLASIFAAFSIPILVILMNNPPELVILSASLSFLVVYRHRENINRLIHGVENKLRKKP